MASIMRALKGRSGFFEGKILSLQRMPNKEDCEIRWGKKRTTIKALYPMTLVAWLSHEN